jgi:hypothetical protein
MRRILPISLGIVMIIAAIYLAASTTNQDSAVQPPVALAFETELHAPPTATATATLRPEPTVTPIVGWNKFTGQGVELWLPPEFGGAADDPTALPESSLLYAMDLKAFHPAPVASVRVLRVEMDASPDVVPFTVLDGRFNHLAQAPVRVSLGRYDAFRSVVDGLVSSGAQIERLLYWIKQDNVYWVMVFTAPTSEFRQWLPAFERSARSFSILP